MKTIKKMIATRVVRPSKFILIGLIIGFSAQVVQAWVEPSTNPPYSNVGAPLTTGASHQTKSAGLTLNSMGTSANGLVVANGNVGIGTIDPMAKLDVAGGNTRMHGTAQIYGDLRIYASESQPWNQPTILIRNDNQLSTVADMRFHKNGGIAAQGNLYLFIDSNNGGDNNFFIKKNTDDYNGGANILRLTESAVLSDISKIVINRDSNTVADDALDITRQGQGRVAIFRNMGNSNVCAINPQNSSVGCSSDERLKKNISEIQDSLEKIMNIRGVNFQWKNQEDQSNHTGVIAQEIEEAMPELVETDKDDGYKTVNYAGFTPYLIEAVKELKAENDDLRARIEKLEQER